MLHLGRTYDLMDLDGHGHAFERLGPEIMAGEIPLDEPLRRRTDEHRIGRRQPLEAGRNIGRVAQGELFLPPPAPHLPHDDQPSMAPQAHGQLHPALLPQAGVELRHGFHHAQPSPHGPLRVIFVRPGIAEVDEQAITEILGDMPLKAGDHRGTGRLIGTHHFAQLLRVELAGEGGRVHQVTEQHGELAAFRLRGAGVSGRRFSRGGMGVLRDGLPDRWWIAMPSQALAGIIDHLRVLIEEGFLEILERRVIEVELPFERAIRHPPAALEHGKRLVQHRLEGHGRPSPALARASTESNVRQGVVSCGKQAHREYTRSREE
jgi:hypothetical protein